VNDLTATESSPTASFAEISLELRQAQDLYQFVVRYWDALVIEQQLNEGAEHGFAFASVRESGRIR
jgi:hypothetical protein